MIYMHFQLREDEEISKLVKKYGDDYQLTYISWANSGISNMDLYERNGSEEYKLEALKSVDKALKILPGYGTAMAVKILVHIITYVNRASEKAPVKKEIDSLFLEVNSGSSSLISYETWSYLQLLDNDSNAFKKYIDILFIDFKDQMDKMVSRYNDFLKKPGAL